MNLAFTRLTRAARDLAVAAFLAALSGAVPFDGRAHAATWDTFNNANSLNVVEAGPDGVWCGSDRGLHLYDPATRRFTRYSKQIDGLASNAIRSIAVDAGGNTWFGTADRGVSVLRSSGGWRTLNTFDGLPANTVSAIEPSSVGTWVGTPDGLAVFDDTYQLVALWPDGVNPSPFRSNDVRDIAQFDDSLWIGTADGIYATRSEEGLTWAERSQGLPIPNLRALINYAGEAWCIANDHIYRGGNLGDWTLAEAGLPAGTAQSLDGRGGHFLAGTSNGVFEWDGAQWVLLGGGLPPRAWVDVAETGDFWAGNAEGLWHWNLAFWERSTSPGPSGNYVHAMALQGSTLYLTTRFNGVSRFDGTTWRNFLPGAQPDTSLLSQDFIFSLLIDQDGTKWVGDWGGGISRFDDSTEPPSFTHYYTVAEGSFSERNTFAWSSAQDAQGRRWFGYDTRSLGDPTLTPIGINRIDQAEQRVNFNPQNSLMTGPQIRSIAFAPGGGFEMWVAYAGLGVDVFTDPTLATRLDRITTPDLLSMDTWGIQFYGNDVWVATSSGLTRFDRATRTRREAVGTQPPSSNGSVNPFAVDAHGGVWYGTLAGLFHRAPDGTTEVFNETNSPLLSNDIHSVVVDPENDDVWIGTIIGVNRYQPGGSTPGPTPSSASRFNVYPNPAFASSAGVILRTGDFTGSFKGRVFDIRGRVVRHLLGSATTGTLWDAKDDRGVDVRPGLYILEVTQGSTVRTGRVFLFR